MPLSARSERTVRALECGISTLRCENQKTKNYSRWLFQILRRGRRHPRGLSANIESDNDDLQEAPKQNLRISKVRKVAVTGKR